MLTPQDEVAIHLPDVTPGSLDQDQEYCEVEIEGRRRRVRFHAYHEIFSVPGLYESLFEKLLDCNSPGVVTSLLNEELAFEGEEPESLRVLDFGAGNGMVAEELTRIGVDSIVGVDILEVAKEAAERDRPGIYADYLATDMTAPAPPDLQALERHDFNCLTCVAALGFGDVPPAAFVNAFNLVSAPGWVAFNIRERLLGSQDESGFSALLHQMFDEGVMVERAREQYPHRRSTAGDRIPYVAMVAEKRADAPPAWAEG
jgi:SAM-dependent methyltransferase